eukprot:210323_1
MDEYKKQVPNIIESCAKEPDVMYFLAARSVNDGFGILPSLVDAYTRDRVIAKFKGKDAPTIVAWSRSNAFLQKLQLNDKGLATKIEDAIKGYCNRISPLLQFAPLFEIDDSIEKVANYLVSASSFID